MEKQTAINIIRDTFQNSFDKERFFFFIECSTLKHIVRQRQTPVKSTSYTA